MKLAKYDSLLGRAILVEKLTLYVIIGHYKLCRMSPSNYIIYPVRSLHATLIPAAAERRGENKGYFAVNSQEIIKCKMFVMMRKYYEETYWPIYHKLVKTNLPE